MKIKKPKRGAPRKSPDKAKSETLQIRVNASEKQAFHDAAEQDGKKVSEWIRDRLRRLAREELQERGMSVPFMAGPLS